MVGLTCSNIENFYLIVSFLIPTDIVLYIYRKETDTLISHIHFMLD